MKKLSLMLLFGAILLFASCGGSETQEGEHGPKEEMHKDHKGPHGDKCEGGKCEGKKDKCAGKCGSENCDPATCETNKENCKGQCATKSDSTVVEETTTPEEGAE